MRNLNRIILLAFLFLSIGVNAQQKARIAFDTQKHDFGMVREEGGIVSYNFHFKNTGKVPLVINNVIASCGCTTPEWSKAPIPPGGKGFIRISYNPLHRPGEFVKDIRVVSNADNAVIALVINGKVQEHVKGISELYPREMGPLKTKSNYISFTNVLDHEIKTEIVDFYNDSKEPVKIGVKSSPNHILAKVKDAEIAPGSTGSVKISFDAKKCHMYGFVIDRVFLTINGEANYDYSIGVSANIMEDFTKLSQKEKALAPVLSIETDTYDFGDIKEGQSVNHVFRLYNKGKSNLIIRRIRTSCGCTVANPSLNVIPEAKESDLQVVFDSKGKRGRQSKAIEVITNDPQNPVANLTVNGNVLSND